MRISAVIGRLITLVIFALYFFPTYILTAAAYFLAKSWWNGYEIPLTILVGIVSLAFNLRLIDQFMNEELDKLEVEKGKKFAQQQAKPDKWTLNGALTSLIEKKGNDYEAAQMVINFGLSIDPSTDFVQFMTREKKNKSDFTGHTQEFGNVTMKEDGQDDDAESKIINGVFHKESVGNYFVWRHKDKVKFSHFWKFNISSVRSDFVFPPVFSLYFDESFRPVYFCVAEMETRLEEIRIFWIKPIQRLMCIAHERVLFHYDVPASSDKD